MKNLKQLIRQTVSAILMLMAFCTTMQAQNGVTVSGTVSDEAGEPLIGASVIVKGNSSLGTVTDFDGNFQLKVPSEQTTLVISYVGMTSKEVKVGKQRSFKVTLKDDTQLEEVVVVGFGQQKKASVVGAITQTTGEVLERAAGIGSVGAALTGNLPGVATIASTGQPGEEDPRIYIRGAAAWNQDAQPLILVDGVKRDIKSVDITSVATVSVLKDASATAVYGVEGANGVILITTKRGQEGKARIDVGFNPTLKAVLKLPGASIMQYRYRLRIGCRAAFKRKALPFWSFGISPSSVARLSAAGIISTFFILAAWISSWAGVPVNSSKAPPAPLVPRVSLRSAWSFKSIHNTRFPFWARPSARVAAVVVFPVPPFWDTMVIIRIFSAAPFEKYLPFLSTVKRHFRRYSGVFYVYSGKTFAIILARYNLSRLQQLFLHTKKPQNPHKYWVPGLLR